MKSTTKIKKTKTFPLIDSRLKMMASCPQVVVTYRDLFESSLSLKKKRSLLARALRIKRRTALHTKRMELILQSRKIYLILGLIGLFSTKLKKRAAVMCKSNLLRTTEG